MWEMTKTFLYLLLLLFIEYTVAITTFSKNFFTDVTFFCRFPTNLSYFFVPRFLLNQTKTVWRQNKVHSICTYLYFTFSNNSKFHFRFASDCKTKTFSGLVLHPFFLKCVNLTFWIWFHSTSDKGPLVLCLNKTKLAKFEK